MGLKTRRITVYHNRGYYISPVVMLYNNITGCYITVMRSDEVFIYAKGDCFKVQKKG